MNKSEKSFNFKLYGVITFFAVAAILVIICVSTFQARYTAFHPDELAKTYVDTIVRTGDGYNAYKNTLASKSVKYGDFIREYYINPVVYSNGENEKGFNDDSYKGEKTLNDDGSLSGLLNEKMYPVYEKLVAEYGWDDYDSIYKLYIDELVKTREEIFGDMFFNDEVFFTAFEANVSEYGKKLTGTEDVFDENTGIQLSYASEGVYQNVFGEDYEFFYDVIAENTVSIEEYKQNADKEIFAKYGVDVDEILEVRSLAVALHTIEDDSVSNYTLAQVDVVIVKIGSSWYVDNTSTDTSELYSFYK